MNNLHNIFFKIGQPNTGKSFSFEKRILEEKLGVLNSTDINFPIQYVKIPVSGGIGNEFKGLQNTDLAISFNPINKELKFGEFLITLMNAIINPDKNFVVFLDDFHNQNISSLLSEYTPLFKSQQKKDIGSIISRINQNDPNIISALKFPVAFKDHNQFINSWNGLINCLEETAKSLGKNVPVVSITNRISGNNIKLVYPSNFFLFGAANYNEHTYNIFADWKDRAFIEEIDPLKDEQFLLKKVELLNQDDKEFINLIIQINSSLKTILETNNIFNYERYCFGFFKAFENENDIVFGDEKRKGTIKFIFSMIKNSLVQNSKSSLVNSVGFLLIKELEACSKEKGFSDAFMKYISNKSIVQGNYKLLHELGIYEE